MLILGTTHYFGVVSENWSPLDEEEELEEILYISSNESVVKESSNYHLIDDKGEGNKKSDATDMEYIVIKDMHQPFYDEMPANCAVASSYYSLTAHRSFYKFDGTGMLVLLQLKINKRFNSFFP